ncbi:LacI family DNA-binding transcriptional regulator [Rhodococcoides yunnanense]|uniref:LacI family DNA-binding transcriptional regulator n=1 Tax=Rhodococcoides yunnanense TaxID=278209 RepID=UPI0009332F41|nr:LacI family DNA-binding transcriptional regulator [Rhodococcus yunnanensis]
MSTRPTMADVAVAAGVSTMSVSYTYNQPARVSEATRQRVLAAASTLGYAGPHRAAKALRSGKTNNLGVVLTETLTYSFENPQARAFLSGIAEACLDTDTGLVLLPNSRIDADLARVRDAHVDGYIVWTTVVDDPMLDTAVATGKPVCIQGGPAHPGTQIIGIDDTAAAHAIGTIGLAAAERPAIISFPRNRDRITGIVFGPEPRDATFPVTAARLAGYRRAVVEMGFGWDRVPVAFVATNTRAAGTAAARTLLSEHRVDAILCSSDDLALGVLDVGAPGISVTGWDDSDAAEPAGLTTVAQSLYDQGRDAARWVLGTLPSIPPAQWSLRIRSSTR